MERESYNFQVEEASNIFQLLYCQPDFEGKLPWCPDWDGVIAEYVLDESDEENDENLVDSLALKSVPHRDFESKLTDCSNLPDDGFIEEYVLEESDEEDDENSEDRRGRANAQTETDAEVAFQVGKRLKEMLIEVESLDY